MPGGRLAAETAFVEVGAFVDAGEFVEAVGAFVVALVAGAFVCGV